MTKKIKKGKEIEKEKVYCYECEHMDIYDHHRCTLGIYGEVVHKETHYHREYSTRDTVKIYKSEVDNKNNHCDRFEKRMLQRFSIAPVDPNESAWKKFVDLVSFHIW